VEEVVVEEEGSVEDERQMHDCSTSNALHPKMSNVPLGTVRGIQYHQPRKRMSLGILQGNVELSRGTASRIDARTRPYDPHFAIIEEMNTASRSLESHLAEEFQQSAHLFVHINTKDEVYIVLWVVGEWFSGLVCELILPYSHRRANFSSPGTVPFSQNSI